jgi:hypothetical protein
MTDEKIKVRVTETGRLMDVVVISKRVDRIQVLVGEGVHSVKCDLTATRNGLSYAGSVMGRELVYEHSREQLQAEIDREKAALERTRGQQSRRSVT